MIPSGQVDARRARDLNWWLIQELRQCMADRAIQEKNWVRYEKVYRARPEKSKKDFPFVNASNLVVPVAATDIDTLYARLMGLLFEPRNLWSCTAQRPEMVDFADALQNFLQWAQENEISPYRAVGNWLIELHKLGTGILKQRYVREMKKVFEWRELEQGNFQQQAIIMLKDHPQIDHVRLHDFYIPAGFPLIQQAPWVAERVRLTWMQFMNRVKAGLYVNPQSVGAYFFSPPINRVQQLYDEISEYKPAINTQLELYEFWLDYDIDGDGWDEALVCTIHLDSQTIVRLDYNPFFHQEKPYSSANFMRDVNSFYGIGLCEMLDKFQEEITAMHNQRIDAGTVSLAPTWAVKKDNQNIKPNEPVYVNKIWRLNDPKNDLVRMPLGDGGAVSTLIASEGAVRNEAQRRTGVNDYISANASPEIGYGAAYTTQQMLLNSSKRFSETLREVHQALGESGTRVAELYQQYNQRGKPFIALGQREGQMVDVVLKFPTDLIRKGVRITVTAIDAASSADSRIRTTTIVFQQLSNFYTNYLQLLSYAANPGMPPIIQQTAIQAAQGSAVMMRRLLELYGIEDYDTMLPELGGAQAEQQRTLQNIYAILQSAQAGARPTQSGPAGPSQQPQAAPGVSAIPGGAAGIPGPGFIPTAQNGAFAPQGAPAPGPYSGAGMGGRSALPLGR